MDPGALTVLSGVNRTLQINFGGANNLIFNQRYTPATSAFTVLDGETPLTVGSVTVNPYVVVLTLTGTVGPGDSVTLSYAPPGSNPIQDTAGNLLAAIASAAVTVVAGGPTVICGYIGAPQGSPNATPVYLDFDCGWYDGTFAPSQYWPIYLKPVNANLKVDYWAVSYNPSPGRDLAGSGAPCLCRAAQSIRVPEAELIALIAAGAVEGDLKSAYWQFRNP